jgi:DNA-binding CsgD family transcriptional regulator
MDPNSCFDEWWQSKGQAMASKLCGRWPRLRDDMLADVYVLAKRRTPQFDPDRGSADAWLYQICRKVYSEKGRRWNRKSDPRRHEVECDLSKIPAPEAIVAAPARPHITARNLEVLLTVAKGDGVPGAALALGMKPKTVHFHLQRVYLALGIRRPWRMLEALHELVRLKAITPDQIFAEDL